ncbi:hypothetical protein [Novosphingobium guangzhouense]|uniref:hypothetical protein n=1 Tax=Novosphingobium guangzhouense TaxID=1850347 RepID=UPI0011AED984|nr:hypothetical protein [Novosphingobium guangzhouense]
MTLKLPPFAPEDEIFRHGIRKAEARLRADALVSLSDDHWRDRATKVEKVQHAVDLANALFGSGKITADEYLLYATYRVDDYHTTLWLSGAYPEVEKLALEIHQIESDHDLSNGQYWLRGEGPPEHVVATNLHEAALDERFVVALEKFGLVEIAELWRTDRAEYDRRHKIGRLTVFEKENVQKSVSDSIETYEEEARRCASAEAYCAACVMLGSAAEARILRMCLVYYGEVTEVLATKTKSQKPRNPDPLHWTLETLISLAEELGWLPDLENGEITVKIASWLSSLRDTRNLLHPGRHARDRPHDVIGREEYDDANHAYTALRLSLERVMVRKMTSGG